MSLGSGDRPLVFISKAQLLSSRIADAVRRPFRLPDKIDFHFAHLRNTGQAVVDLFEDQSAGWALRRSQGHGDLDALAWKGRSGVWIGVRDDVVDQAQVDKIELDFGVEAVAQRSQDLFGAQNR